MSADLAINIKNVRTLNLKSLHLHVPARMFCAFTGPSGAGKTALLLDSVWGYQCEQLASFAVRPIPLRSKPEIERVDASLPTINLNSLLASIPRRSSLARCAGLEGPLRELFAEHARFGCGEPGCVGVDSEAVRQEVQSAGGRVFLGAFVDLPQSLSSQKTLIETLLRRGYSRFLFDNVWKERVSLENGIPEAILSSLVVLLDSLEASDLDKLRTEEAIRIASEFGASRITVYQEGSSLSREITEDWRQILLFTRPNCSRCSQGAGSPRTSQPSLERFLHGQTFESFLALPVREALVALRGMENPEADAIAFSLQMFDSLGLAHLSLSRSVSSLSSGEQFFFVLLFLEMADTTDTLFLIDEPGQFFSVNDLGRVSDWSRRMIAQGNTVLIADRSSTWLRNCDRVLTLGPGSGKKGGEITADVPGSEFRYVMPAIEPASSPREFSHRICTLVPPWQKELVIPIHSASTVALVGPFGAGKTQLLRAMFEQLKRNKPLLRTMGFKDCELMIGNEMIASSGVLADMLGVAPLIAGLFASLSAAKRKGLKKSSFLISKGSDMCEACRGSGFTTGLESAWRESCDYCGGKKFSPPVLEVLFHEQNIFELLSLPISRAISEFGSDEAIVRILTRCDQFGLGELPLIADASTLSDSLHTRAALIQMLAKRKNAATLYLLDQPFSGLDDSEAESLSFQLRSSAHGAEKNSFFFSTHHPLAIAQADFVFALGLRAEQKFFGPSANFSLNDYV